VTIKRVAAIDCGTNSIRLLIADINSTAEDTERTLGSPGASATTSSPLTDIAREMRIVRLGEGVDRTGRLSEVALDRTMTALREYAGLIAEAKPDAVRMVATSATRDAANSQEFTDRVVEVLGVAPEVISGDAEARLSFTGATRELAGTALAAEGACPPPYLVTDIGGGSTEFVIGHGREARFHVSTQAGAVRQTERHLHHDPPLPRELEELAADVRSIIAAAVPTEQRRVEHAIGVAGTPTALAAVAQALEPYDPDRVQGYLLARDECERLLALLASLPVSERREVPGLHPDRAPTIVAGTAILAEIMRLFELEHIEVSEHDILRGAALAFSLDP
jgi:exopolyphosphatase / guanosine-5'-triphosphate,3'-diphosphate pyrophosphatase